MSDAMQIDELTEFAAWLTTRDEVIAVGGSETVYAMFDALEEFKAMKASQAAAFPVMLAALKEADRLYSSYGLVADHKDCGPWINSVRDAINASRVSPTEGERG